VDKLSCSFDDAKEIDALRRVFGESYPTTVRVVAVGAPGIISEMVADPKDKKWFGTSVEFCGGTHLDNAGEAEQFVILAEEGCARGVRRIVGLTAGKAAEALAAAEALEKRFAAAENLDGLELNAEIKLLTVDLDMGGIPVVPRDALKSKLKGLNKKYLKWKKQYLKTLETTVIKSVDTIAEEQKGAPFLVLSIDAQGAGKILKKAGAALSKKLKSTPILLYSVDPDANSLAVFASVPKDSAVNAAEFARALVVPCGGKAGGKGTTSAGASRDATNLAAGVAAATTYVQGVLA